MTAESKPRGLCRKPPRTARRAHGFTLIELIMVLVLVGVLAVVAIPRMFSGDDFTTRGFHDATMALLRYAQKTAVAQRRTVCVTFASTTSASLSINAAADTVGCTQALDDPGASTLTARGAAAYKVQPGNFNFDALGQPVNASGTALATQTLQFNNSAISDVTVEAGTGYVHD